MKVFGSIYYEHDWAKLCDGVLIKFLVVTQKAFMFIWKIHNIYKKGQLMREWLYT